MMGSSSRTSFARGLLRLLILKLASQKPVTGVTIAQDVHGLSEGLWRPSPGSVYYLLNELEDKGLLTHLPVGAGRERRLVLSKQGEAELRSAAEGIADECRRQLAGAFLLWRTFKPGFPEALSNVVFHSLGAAKKNERTVTELLGRFAETLRILS